MFTTIIAVMVISSSSCMLPFPKTVLYDDKKLLNFLSHTFSVFTGQNALVIGAGPSGMDLANEISKVAKRVTLSHHQNPEPKTVFASNVDMRPDVERLTENGVVFVDGTEQDYSVIVYCTGYKYTFPFLSVDCGIAVDDNFVQPLYKHCININYPTMALIGVPFYVCASQMFDLQVISFFLVLFCLFPLMSYSFVWVFIFLVFSPFRLTLSLLVSIDDVAKLLSRFNWKKVIRSSKIYERWFHSYVHAIYQFVYLTLFFFSICSAGPICNEIFLKTKRASIKSGNACRDK